MTSIPTSARLAMTLAAAALLVATAAQAQQFDPPEAFQLDSGMVGTGDFNGDGRSDFVTGPAIAAMIRTATGGFTVVTSPDLQCYGQQLEVADMDRDGLDDLVLYDYGSLCVARSLGDGTFEMVAQLQQGNGANGNWNITGLTIGDVVGGPALDIVFTDERTSEVVIVPSGSGNFLRYTVAGRLSGVAAGDVDGDGRADIVVHTSLQGAPGGRLLALVSNGSSFTTTWTLDLDENQLSNAATLALADFTGDGRPDLLASEGNLYSFLNLGGTFGPPQSAGVYADGFIVGDFSGDARLDLVTPNFSGGSVHLGLAAGVGNGTFAPVVDWGHHRKPVGRGAGRQRPPERAGGRDLCPAVPRGSAAERGGG